MSNGHTAKTGGAPGIAPTTILVWVVTLVLIPATYRALFDLPPRVSVIEATQKTLVDLPPRVSSLQTTQKTLLDLPPRVSSLEATQKSVLDATDRMNSRDLHGRVTSLETKAEAIKGRVERLERKVYE